MKKNLLCAGILLAAAGAYAQPTLTMANNGYAIGDEYRFFRSDFTDDGDDGAGSVWDLSSYAMGETPYQVAKVIAPPAAIAVDFPSANVAVEAIDEGATIYSMYKVSETGMANYGVVVSDGAVIKYSDPEEILRYPMTVGSSYTDAFHGTVTAGAVTMQRGGNTTVNVTGYGSLATPAGTYSSALKVRTHQVYADTFMGSPMINYDFDIYQWFVPGHHTGLAGITFITAPSPETYAAFTESDPTSLGEVIALKDLISFYPNPASDKIFIRNAGNKKLESIYITDITGSVKFRFDGEQAMHIGQIDISSLPPANYVLHVVAEGGIRAGEVIVKK